MGSTRPEASSATQCAPTEVLPQWSRDHARACVAVIGGILLLVFGWALVGLAYTVLGILSLGLGFIVLLGRRAMPIDSGVWAYRTTDANNRRTHAA
ncbi:MAG: hypothetical protein DLM69_12195 [Candidatus Chloroheliales bacterium]|nr:MAG: hypothetical protein DLM69_12195 [Chloroflexota bacterium]